MMRFTGTLGACLAALTVVPATLGSDDSNTALASIEGALSRTVYALELLAGIRSAETPTEMAIVRELTEAPLASGPEREEKLDLLRTQVSLLQQQLDIVEQRLQARSDDPSAPVVPAAPPEDPSQPEAVQQQGITVGLGADVLAALSEVGVPPAIQATRPEAPKDLEKPAYSADPVLHARACFRAGRYELGRMLLADDDTTPGLYWRARCLEKLERMDEAAVLYATVAERADAGSLADLARTNLEFVQWKLGFEATLPPQLQGRKESGTR